jgi:hypothetical protein
MNFGSTLECSRDVSVIAPKVRVARGRTNGKTSKGAALFSATGTCDALHNLAEV